MTAENDSTATKKSKIIIMGNANVGKTSIINAFIENSSMRGRFKQNTNVIKDSKKVVSVKDDKNARH